MLDITSYQYNYVERVVKWWGTNKKTGTSEELSNTHDSRYIRMLLLFVNPNSEFDTFLFCLDLCVPIMQKLCLPITFFVIFFI